MNAFEPENKSSRIVAAVSGHRIHRPGSDDPAVDFAEMKEGWIRETEILLRDGPDLIVTAENSDNPCFDGQSEESRRVSGREMEGET